MVTVERLEAALNYARRMGFSIRFEWLDGTGGGCVLKGQKWIFVDLALSPHEQLEQVTTALEGEAARHGVRLPNFFGVSRAA